MRDLWLFDIDGVLVDPKGYKFALRDTVDYFAAQMGLAQPHLTLAEIAVFEACGLTNEWDSAALSVGALLVDVVETSPHLVRTNFADTVAAIAANGQHYPRPDFVSIAQQVAQQNTDHAVPTVLCRAVLRARTTQEVDALLATLFDDIFDIRTPTTSVQQVHTLGSQNFAHTYGIVASFDCESYLMRYDQPLLSDVGRTALLEWKVIEQHGFAIYTARPSLPPDGDVKGYAPEADLAAELLQLDGQVPLIAAGRMDWLARQHGRRAADYIKPSPVQALSAIGAAACGDEVQALHAAAALFEHDELIQPLASLDRARVVVFEDSTGGIRAMQQAVQLLQAAGVAVQLEAYGISPEAPKREALATVTAHIADDVNTALRQMFNR